MFIDRRITVLKWPYIESNTNKIATVFKVECEKMIIKCIWSCKGTRIAKTILQKQKDGG